MSRAVFIPVLVAVVAINTHGASAQSPLPDKPPISIGNLAATRPPNTICRSNEMYSFCSSPCVRTCRNETPREPCPRTCRAGCVCRSGYVRRDNGLCVKPSNCPPDEVSPEE